MISQKDQIQIHSTKQQTTMNSQQSSVQFQPSKRRQSSKTRQQTLLSQILPSNIIYNLKDFLPQSSSINIESRTKIKSTILPQNSSFTSKAHEKQAILNVEQKLIQQKLNKLKQSNTQLQQTVDSQKIMINRQSQEIQKLKSELNALKLAEQNKAKRLSLWSYKYHAQYAPKQKYKYSLAVQTVDEDGGRVYGQVSTSSLRAKDFEDIYRRLNSSAPIDMMKKKPTKQTTKPSLNNLTLKNPSTVTQPQNRSTLKLAKLFSQNHSLIQPPHQNKQNIMQWSNINFDANPMSINLEKIQAQEKPIKEQCIEIYPVDEGYLEGIVGEILCGEE